MDNLTFKVNPRAERVKTLILLSWYVQAFKEMDLFKNDYKCDIYKDASIIETHTFITLCLGLHHVIVFITIVSWFNYKPQNTLWSM